MTKLTIQNSEPKNQFSLRMIMQKWHAQNKIPHPDIRWTDFEIQGRVWNLVEEKILRGAVRHDSLSHKPNRTNKNMNDYIGR